MSAIYRGEVALVIVDLPTPAAPVTTNRGGRMKGRWCAQCGQRSTSPTAGIKPGKALRRPQPSHVNGTPRLCSQTAFGSAELFGQRDDDATGTAEVAEPIEILVLRHLTDELGAMGPHAGYDVVDVVDSEHDAT